MNRETFSDVERKLFQMSRDLTEIAVANDPIAFRGALGGVLANCLGHLPDEYFARLCELKPCGVPDCTCHLELGRVAVEYFQKLRADWEEVVKARAYNQ